MRAVAVIKTGSAFDFALSAYQKDRELYLGTKLSALEKWFGFCCMKRLGVFLLPPDGMQVNLKASPGMKFAGAHLSLRRGAPVLIW